MINDLDTLVFVLKKTFQDLGLKRFTVEKKIDNPLYFDSSVFISGSSLGIFVTQENNVFSVFEIEHIPGRFNPRDGGTPPDVREIERGNYKTVHETVLSVMNCITADMVSDIMEELKYKELAYEELAEEETPGPTPIE